MHADVGDHIHVNGRRVGSPARDGTILEVRGPNGAPPYVVDWSAHRSPALYYPGPDAQIVQTGAVATNQPRSSRRA
ncbi:MAG: DUF1918 domain-containing protein [Nocardioidaceae bacterium]